MATSQKTINRKKRHNRVRSKIYGTKTKPRLVVFKSLNNHYVQLIDDDKGITLIGLSDLKDKKGTKTERAKLLGKKIAKLAKEKKITTCVFDRNGYKYHGRVKALADSARENGLKF